jgi:Xaa-Pro aminopeptidase
MTESPAARRMESLLADFEPDFAFIPPKPLPEEEYIERLRRIRREAVVNGHDAMIVHTGMVGWFHTSNGYLRYICDWVREGVLIIPTDSDKELVLLSFYTESVILPPGGEAMLVEEIWQIGATGREYSDRPGSWIAMTADATANKLASLGFASGQIGRIGDRTSADLFSQIAALMPRAAFVSDNGIIDRMQRVHSPREIEMFRAASQLISIGTQAAYHATRVGATDAEIYAAFTFAQVARGGETADGYQIGVNEFGTHCGKPYGHVVRNGDLINLYISSVTYQGYNSQSARMIAVGDITAKQEDVLAMCVDGVRRAEKLIRPGALVSEINNAAFAPYVSRGLLDSPAARSMPYIWAPGTGGGPRILKSQYVPDADLEAHGRKLRHVYPAAHGPHNPNLGHSVGMAGFSNGYNVSSHNYDRLEVGMVFVLHTQWIEPLVAGCNVGDCYVVTAEGYENMTRHTPLEPFRVPKG